MLKIIFITVSTLLVVFVLYVATFGYWRLGKKMTQEITLPIIALSESSINWELHFSDIENLCDGDFRSSMYLIKSLSGILSLRMNVKDNRIHFIAGPPSNLVLDHDGATIRGVYYGITDLNPNKNIIFEGEKYSYPYIAINAELYIIDNIFQPLKLKYEWRFKYDSNKKQFLRVDLAPHHN